MKEDYLTDELPASVLDTLHHPGAEGRDNPCQEVGLRKDIRVRLGLLRQGREKDYVQLRAGEGERSGRERYSGVLPEGVLPHKDNAPQLYCERAEDHRL